MSIATSIIRANVISLPVLRFGSEGNDSEHLWAIGVLQKAHRRTLW
jgi:hypothetical protein